MVGNHAGSSKVVALLSIAIFWALTAHPSYAALQLYVDGTLAPSGIALSGSDPLPTLGVGATSTAPWSGVVYSSDFVLANGQVASTNPSVYSSIVSQAPSTYEMTSVYQNAGIQFTMDMVTGGNYSSLITLWDSASVFDVPVDTMHIYRGGWPGFEWSNIAADAGGPYQLAEGESVTFDATDSTCTLWFEVEFDVYESYTYRLSDDGNLPYWSINGVDIAFGMTPTISYDTLVNGLNLTPGIYDLTLNLEAPIFGSDTATTTIEILPEPATVLVLALGSMGALIRRSRP